MDIIGGLSAVTQALGIAKTLNEVDRSLDTANFRMKLADLETSLASAKLALIDAREESLEKDKEIQRLKDNFLARQDLVIGEGGYKYILNSSGEREGFPICPKCENLDGRIIRLVRNVKVDSCKCPACSTEFCPVTCYVPASENDGVETTAVARFYEKRAVAQERRSRRFAQMNSGPSWMDR